MHCNSCFPLFHDGGVSSQSLTRVLGRVDSTLGPDSPLDLAVDDAEFDAVDNEILLWHINTGYKLSYIHGRSAGNTANPSVFDARYSYEPAEHDPIRRLLARSLLPVACRLQQFSR